MAATGGEVDSDFIRRGLALADPNAVRIALLQQTGDPAIAALPPAAAMDDAQRALLIDRAAAWLAANASPDMPAEPPLDDLRRLMTLATGRAMSDHEFEARRDLPAFRPFPFALARSHTQPAIPEGFKVAIIGSGIAGIAAGVQCELLGLPYVVLERQPRPGGTWASNLYPDVRVDTPSINYEYSFEKLYPWDEHFGRGAQVRSYLEHVSTKHGVRANTRFGHELRAATFDEGRDLWLLDVDTPEGAQTIEAAILITAVGVFANPKLPAFEGQERFAGRIVHTARWPDDLDLKGKRVAIIGNGSTGVQILGAVAREAAQVHVFQRTPQWISPRERYGQPIAPELAWIVANFPGYWNWWRYMVTAAQFDLHDFQLPDAAWQAQGGKVNAANDQLRAFLTGYIAQETGGRQDLIDRLVPDYAPFSRRPVVDNGWYRALTRDNVELVTAPIARLTADGIETADGAERPIDVVIAATGFEVVKYLWPARFTGRGGRDLHRGWDEGDGPRAYLGMMSPGFPNMFMLYGPNSQPVTGGTALPSWYLIWSAYAAQAVLAMLAQGRTRVEVKPEAYARYNEALDAEAAKLVQMSAEGAMEKNYYVNAAHRRLQVNAPWLSPDFHRMCTVIDWNDLELG